MTANARNGWLTPAVDEPPSLPRDRISGVKRLLWSLLQGVLIFLSFQIYKIVRRFGVPDDPHIAFEHAKTIIQFEDRVGLFFERDWQRWALAQPEWYIRTFNYLYAWYMWWVIGGLSLVAFLAPVRYCFLRRAFFTSMMLVLPMYLVYPLAPPRFMDAHGWPFIDTLAVYGPNYFSETGIVQANRYAAMPSMHVGWTTFVAIAVSMLLPSPKVRVAFVSFMASLITYIVIVTGNHYWLDALVGWMFIGTAIAINRYLPYPLLANLEDRGTNRVARPLRKVSECVARRDGDADDITDSA